MSVIDPKRTLATIRTTRHPPIRHVVGVASQMIFDQLGNSESGLQN
jgi:hypothetical protein